MKAACDYQTPDWTDADVETLRHVSIRQTKLMATYLYCHSSNFPTNSYPDVNALNKDYYCEVICFTDAIVEINSLIFSNG